MHFRMNKDDDADIMFALSCLGYGAILFREFKEWLYFVIEHAEEPPSYVFDMLDVKIRRDFYPMEIMGWHNSDGLSEEEWGSLKGIGVLRGINSLHKDDGLTSSEAVAILKNNEAFFNRVKAFFPFLDLDRVVGPDPDKGW